jgi:hypothetical protein
LRVGGTLILQLPEHLRRLMKCLELWMTKIGPFSWLRRRL